MTRGRRLRTSLGTLAKRSLLRMGARAGERTIHYLNGALEYLELGHWLEAQGFSGGVRVASCFDVFEPIAEEVAESEVLYLQFGAVDAGMVERWGRLLRNPASRLDVFAPVDTFADVWLPVRGRGHTWESTPRADAVAGVRSLLPRDPRVRLFEGEPLAVLLGSYEWPAAEVVVASFDTDHYATTKVGLDELGGRLPIGSYVFFDQLNHRGDELRALHEFLLESGAAFELVAANEVLSCAAFRRVARRSWQSAPAGD